MQRRVTGYVTPEKIWAGQRSIQNELTTKGLTEYYSPVEPRAIGAFNVRNQLIADEALKHTGTSPIIPLVRLCSEIRAAIVAALETIAAIRNPDNYYLRYLVFGIQLTVIRHQEWKKCPAVKNVNRWIALIRMLFISVRKHDENVIIPGNSLGIKSQIVGVAHPLQETGLQSRGCR